MDELDNELNLFFVLHPGRYKAGEPPDLNKFGSPGYARLEVPVERVGRSWRNSWLVPDTFVTISTFPSMDDVRTFYNDGKETPGYITVIAYKMALYIFLLHL